MNLYETYELNEDRVGEWYKKQNGREYTLLPISHTTQNAHIEVTVTEEGEFHSAEVIEKEEASTLIPCTEDSASRAGSKIAPYPLHDKLSYVAGDFTMYGGNIKKEEPFVHYIAQLQDWVNSPYSNDKIKSAFNYLQKRELIQDLVKEKILYLDENEKLIDKWNEKHKELHGEKPAIFGVATGGQESAFIRFNVYSPRKNLKKIWQDKEVYDSFINYYKQQLLHDEDICFVTGAIKPTTERHANKIRNAADKAKLISANDTSGYTFRGRFKSGADVASISYDVSQKAHNALKWLIHRQGKVVDQRVFLVWGNENLDLPNPTEDPFSLNLLPETPPKKKADTQKEFAREIATAIDGYKNDLSHRADVNIIILDSATTGRLGVNYYRNLDKDVYLRKLKTWHTTCAWLHRYRKNTEDRYVQFYGAPATKDIAFAAYGPRANEKIVKELMSRMVSCVVDERKIPQDIIRSAFYRASNPVSMEKWEWEKTLSITCALINKDEGGFDVALDNEINDRDYLFGRLLAIADVLERRAMDSDEKRATNAIRYMTSFAKHPERTWKTLQESLQPYQARMGKRAGYLSSMIDEVATRINIEDFNNKPLSGKYLLGFYSQRHDLYQKKEDSQMEMKNNISEE
nr:type I-C CRISPR-associated protein Cas8c/Csd1 [Virgibacillus halodenitrificans]